MNAFAAFGFAYLCLAFAAVDLSTFLGSQCGAGTTTYGGAPLWLGSAAEVLLPLAALGVLLVAVAHAYNHLSRRHAAAAGNVRRSISGLIMFLLCVSAGTVELIVFGEQAAATGGGGGGGPDHGALVGLAALRALPSAATVMFFLGMMMLTVAGAAHVPAGGEAGDTGAVAGDGPIQGLLRVIPKVAAGAAAALVGLMVMAITLYGATK